MTVDHSDRVCTQIYVKGKLRQFKLNKTQMKELLRLMKESYYDEDSNGLAGYITLIPKSQRRDVNNEGYINIKISKTDKGSYNRVKNGNNDSNRRNYNNGSSRSNGNNGSRINNGHNNDTGHNDDDDDDDLPF